MPIKRAIDKSDLLLLVEPAYFGDTLLEAEMVGAIWILAEF
jgi:hypothetical protein